MQIDLSPLTLAEREALYEAWAQGSHGGGDVARDVEGRSGVIEVDVFEWRGFSQSLREVIGEDHDVFLAGLAEAIGIKTPGVPGERGSIEVDAEDWDFAALWAAVESSEDRGDLSFSTGREAGSILDDIENDPDSWIVRVSRAEFETLRQVLLDGIRHPDLDGMYRQDVDLDEMIEGVAEAVEVTTDEYSPDDRLRAEDDLDDQEYCEEDYEDDEGDDDEPW